MVIMPSGVRRASRVFGVVKGADGARVLRSGRRLFPDSSDTKLRRVAGDDEWFHSVIKTTSNRPKFQNGIVKSKENGWAPRDTKLKEEAAGEKKIVPLEPKRVSSNNRNKRVKSENRTRRVKSESKNKNKRKKVEIKSKNKRKEVQIESKNKRMKGEKKESLDDDREKRMFGIVYTRKRLRMGMEKEDKMFGIRFSRRQRRKKAAEDDGESSLPVFTVIVESSCTCRFERFFKLVLMHMMKRGSLNVSEFGAFLASDPIRTVFASNGIRFLMDHPPIRTGVCRFFEMGQFVPMFTVDFSAIPSSFTSMHLSINFRVRCLSYEPTCDDEIISESDEEDSIEVKTVAPEANSSGMRLALHPSVRASRLSARNTQARNGLNSRGIQKRRSSFRRRGARNPSVGMHKANGALVSDLITSRKNGIPFSAVVPKNKINYSLRSSSVSKLKRVAPAAVGVVQDMVGVTEDLDMSSCSANILVIEADRCYRVEGATIMLETSDSGECVLAVKKDGLVRYTHVAQKIMRTHASNRHTHDIIWTVDENWRLEFPNKQDWFIFKNLYRECYDNNVPVSNAKTIPVPVFHEVLGYEDNMSAPFARPEVYISVKNDEVARAMAKSNANYDMDNEDEEWLWNYNNDSIGESEHPEHLSEDKFELMVDTFEKALYSSPDDFADEKAVVNHFVELGRREVVEAVCGYWMRKRKQKKLPLLRVFQGHQPKKASLIPKPILRKRRSFKRSISQFGRGKQPSHLQAMAAEYDALAEQNALLRVEEARDSARRAVESAILKRQRAQLLMENAEWATYKAEVALRIAEAASVGDSTEVAAHFLD